MHKDLPNRPLRVFLCHGSEDKPTVREIYSKLLADGIQPWLDEMDLLPGQDWNEEIIKAVRTCDAILVCLSSKSVRKEGYIQKEIMFALDVANEKPEDTIFVIPVKLDACELPRRLSKWQHVEYSTEGSYAKILRALKVRADELGHKNHSDKAVLALPPEDNRPNRVNKLIWIGIVVIVLGTIIGLLSIWGAPIINSRNYQSNTDSSSADVFFSRGEECYEKEDYDCAVDSYTRAIELRPQYAEAFYKRGSAYADKGSYDQAVEDFSKTIELNPQSAEAFYNRGVVYDNRGNTEQAIKDYSRAIELNSQYAAAYNNRGLDYSAIGNYKQAIKDFDKAIRLNPEYAIAYYNRGGAYDDIGRYDQALRDYNKAIELNPQYAEAYFNLGLIYQTRGNYKKAIEAYSRTLELNPQDADAYNARGLAYERLGQTEKAIADRQKYNELSTKK